jgi:excisionase family DNA binding protein
MSEPFVPIEELAKHFSVSVSTIRAWVRQGYIPKHAYLKIGNTYRFSVSKVVAALSTAPKEEPVELVDAVDPNQLELDFDAEEDI